MTSTMGTMTSGRMRLSGTSLTLVSYSTRPSTHSREPNFTCKAGQAQQGQVQLRQRTDRHLACPAPAAPHHRTHNELGQVVGRVPLLPPLRGRLHLWGLTVQVRLGQRLHDAALGTHEGLGLVERHCLVQISALRGSREQDSDREGGRATGADLAQTSSCAPYRPPGSGQSSLGHG